MISRSKTPIDLAEMLCLYTQTVPAYFPPGLRFFKKSALLGESIRWETKKKNSGRSRSRVAWTNNDLRQAGERLLGLSVGPRKVAAN